MYHTTVKKSEAVRAPGLSRSPASNIHQLLIREQWTPDCWTWGALDVQSPATGCNLGRGKYNADFRNNSRALAKRFSINDAVQCCKVVLGDQFRIEANTIWILFIWEQVFRNSSCILPFILSYQNRLKPQPLLINLVQTPHKSLKV